MNNRRRIASAVFLLLLLAGCGVTPTRVVDASQRDSIIASHEVALDCTLIQWQSRPNLTLAESLFQPMPMYPKYGWKYDLELRIDGVVKGEFEDSVLKLNAAHDPADTSQNGSHQLQAGPPWTQKAVVAFNRGLFGARTDWTFVKLADPVSAK